MNPRIYGTEIEYGSMIASPQGARSSDIITKAKIVTDHLNTFRENKNIDQFHVNAARIYIDLMRLEYATPECLTPMEAVAAEIAGSMLITGEISQEKRPGRIIFFKETTGFNDFSRSGLSYAYDDSTCVVSSGCHENYLLDVEKICLREFGGGLPDDRHSDVSKSKFEKLIFSKLCSFLITRQIISGAGTFVFGKFNLSARSNFISKGISEATTCGTRPLLNTRELYRGEGNSRLHLIIGDANMSEVANFLKLGTTGIVLSLLEDGLIPESFEISGDYRNDIEFGLFCVGLTKKICADMTFSEKLIPLKNCKKVSALEFQRKLYDFAFSHYCRRNPSSKLEEETKNIFKWWNFVLSCLESNKLEKLVGVTDWATKLSLGRSLLKRYGISVDDLPQGVIQHEEYPDIKSRLLAVEQRYHELSQDGYYEILKSRGVMKTIIDDNEIKRLMHNPPPGTRAFGRGHFIRFMVEDGLGFKISNIDWNRIILQSTPRCPAGMHLDMHDPFVPVTLQLKRFLVNNGYNLPVLRGGNIDEGPER